MNQRSPSPGVPLALLVETVIAFVAILPSPRFPRAVPELDTSLRFADLRHPVPAAIKAEVLDVAAVPRPRAVRAAVAFVAPVPPFVRPIVVAISVSVIELMVARLPSPRLVRAVIELERSERLFAA